MPINVLIKGILVLGLGIYLKYYINQDRPTPAIKSLRINKAQWELTQTNEHISHYDTADILFNNPIFQLIKLSNSETKTMLVIFNDQLSHNELRLIHIKAAIK
jgi:hypothetical protein